MAWKRAGLFALIAGLVISGSSPAAAQDGQWDARATRVSRDRLEMLLARYERASESSAYSAVLLEEAQEQADLVRERLQHGDFRAGDRVQIIVEDNPEISDTVSVTSDTTILLRGIGELPLRGVLRAELQENVTRAVSSVIRDPRVRTRALVRISVDGAVAAPGYYQADSNELLSELLMRAGGYTAQAKLADARVERNGEVLVGSEDVEEALREGLTIDQLGLRDGDRLFVPASRSGILTGAREFLFLVPTALGLLLSLF